MSDKKSGAILHHENFIDIGELSEEETKHFLTPFAFRIDKSLFGLPLASPSKRATALVIDLILIAILSGIPGVVLALAIAITLYRLSNKQRAKQVTVRIKGTKRRVIMRFVAALILFFILLDTIPKLLVYSGIEPESSVTNISGNIEDNIENDIEGIPLSFKSSIALAGFAVSTMGTIKDSDCMQLECWKNELATVATDMANIKANDVFDIKLAQVTSILTEISEQTTLNLTEQAELTQFMLATYQEKLTKLGHEIMIEGAEQLLVEEVGIPQVSDGQEKSTYSIIELVKGVISDLGLGFGWAAFYFTVFTALNYGQTIGKKIIGIKVLQLDGTPLSFWDSFGRYGGYGAGFATGLLGFIQIYWDPNRQAIHDKISATVVIDVKKARFSQQLSNNKQPN